MKCKAEQKRICVPVLETKCEDTSEQVCLQVRYITWNYDMKDIDNELIKDINNVLIKDIDNDLIKSIFRCHRPPATPAPPWLVAQLRRMSVEFLIPKSAPLLKLRSATRLRRRPTWGPSRSSVYLGLIDVFLALRKSRGILLSSQASHQMIRLHVLLTIIRLVPQKWVNVIFGSV